MTNANLLPSTKFAAALINGRWQEPSDQRRPVINPATGREIGRHAVVGDAEIGAAALSAREAFNRWRAMAPVERSKILIKAASLIDERREKIARILCLEQGKPLKEAREEVARAAETIEWYGQEARRIQGKLLPVADISMRMAVEKVPIGPVAAFTPWNFPISQSARKLGAALAVGCTVILKGSEEAPFCCVELVRAFVDAGIPVGVVQLLFGDPAQISGVLIPHPAIRKISFTGSVPVGRMLASAAGQHLKYATMELGGHAPVIVLADAPQPDTVRMLVGAKYRNAGQVCVSPTRILVESEAFENFVKTFGELASGLKVGDGSHDDTDMGPLVHARRLDVMRELVEDAVAKGARLIAGGKRLALDGFFFEPTVLANVPLSARIMNEEPFGPIAIINAFDDDQAALDEANRLPFGLAAYVFAKSSLRIRQLTSALEAGVISVNGQPVGAPDAPFGGVKDSGFGREGGVEGLEEYLMTKLVAERSW